MKTLLHALERSLGWHLGSAIFDLLGPAVVLLLVVAVGLYLVHRARRRTR